jgi:hypothetical protein
MLGVSPLEKDMLAPFIAGSVVSGGERKLRMMRADLFATLSVSNSKTVVN